MPGLGNRFPQLCCPNLTPRNSSPLREREADRPTDGCRREGGRIDWLLPREEELIQSRSPELFISVSLPRSSPPSLSQLCSLPGSAQASLDSHESFTWCKFKMWHWVAAGVSRGGRGAGVGAAGREQAAKPRAGTRGLLQGHSKVTSPNGGCGEG